MLKQSSKNFSGLPRPFQRLAMTMVENSIILYFKEKQIMPTYSLIVAMTNDRVMGKNNQLPWQMPADLAYFKRTTLDKTIVMGRKTYTSIGRALPKRRNIVITRDKTFSAQDVDVFHSIQEVMTKLSSLPSSTEVFVIGGAEIFSEFLSMANKLYVTFIDANIDGDTFFPTWNNTEWKETFREEHQKDNENQYDYRFMVLERIT
jgi:dihydrofolate reductase